MNVHGCCAVHVVGPPRSTLLGKLSLCDYANRLAGPRLLQMSVSTHFIPVFDATNTTEGNRQNKQVIKRLLFKSWADIVTSFDVKLGYLNKIVNCSQKFSGLAPHDDHEGLSRICSIVMCSIMSEHTLYRSDVVLTVLYTFWSVYFRRTIGSRPNKEQRRFSSTRPVVRHVVRRRMRVLPNGAVRFVLS